MCFGGGGDGGAGEAREEERQRQERIRQGMASIDEVFNTQFTPEFFGRSRQAYLDYATPQLDRQYGRQKESLIYALSRAGLLKSSAGNRQNADLAADFDKARVDIASNALNAENRARSDVENARTSLVSSLQLSSDNQAAASGAVRQAANLNIPQGFSPLGNLFVDAANTIATIGSNERNDFSGIGRSIRMFSPVSRGSSSVIGG